ncbi:MAG: glycosyltransferase family 4 protein [archaeon]
MKIAFITKQFALNTGGIEKVIENFRKSFSAKGHEVIVFNQNGTTKNLFEFNKKGFSLGIKTALLLLKLKPEVAHFHGFRSINFFPRLACRIMKVPCIITPHFDYNKNLFREKLNFFFHKLIGFDRILAITFAEKKILEELGFKKIEVIPDSVDSSVFRPLPKKELGSRKKYSIGGKTFLVLFLGRLASNKGLPYLFGAFNSIKSDDKKLLVVGMENPAFPDTTYKYYASIAGKLNVLDKTIFAGELNEKEVVDAINSSDVLVLPSTSSEAFGLVLIEAMACGKPVVGSSIEGIKEVIVDGFNGFLVPPKKSDELSISLELLLNPVLRQKIGLNGLSLVKTKYSLSAVSEQHLMVYLNLLAEK